MYRIFAALISLWFLAVTPSAQAESSGIRLLNSTLITKLHFDRKPESGKMVAALQVSISKTGSKTSDEAVDTITVLLNPGLRFVRATGPKNQPLQMLSTVTEISGGDMPALNMARITLAAPLTTEAPRTGITIHFEGFLQDLNVNRQSRVGETLHPDYTVLRPQNFAYPIFAEPDMAAIRKAWNHPPFGQVAFVEFAGNNTVASNLSDVEPTLEGGVTKFYLKNKRPTRLATIAIGPYTTLKTDTTLVATLPVNNDDGMSLAGRATIKSDMLDHLIGPAPGTSPFAFVSIPTGHERIALNSALFIPEDRITKGVLDAEILEFLFNQRRARGSGNPGHWATGLDRFLLAAIKGDSDLEQMQQALFQDAKTGIKANPALGKTSLIDYVSKDYTAELDTLSGLLFAGLHDLLGRDAFFALVRGIRAEFTTNYADMESLNEYLEANIDDKKERKLVKNWMEKGRMGKDLAKTATFDALVKRYR